MERHPQESHTDFHRRLVEADRQQRLRDLEKARQEEPARGKEPFQLERFSKAYHSVKPYGLDPLELEIDYYLNHSRAMSLLEYIETVKQTDLYDGGDMHLDPH